MNWTRLRLSIFFWKNRYRQKFKNLIYAFLIFSLFILLRQKFDEKPRDLLNTIKNLLNSLPNFRNEVECKEIFRRNKTAINRARDWTLDEDSEFRKYFWEPLDSADDKYESAKKFRVFIQM